MTPEVDERIRWWDDWKTFGCLPYPGGDMATQPAFVYDAISLCENVHAGALRETEPNRV